MHLGRDRWSAVAAFLLPNLLGFAVFTLVPVALSFGMAFTNWSLKPAVRLEFTAWRNLADLAADARFWRYLWNTVYLMAGIPVAIAGSLALALLLAEDLPLSGGRARRIGVAVCAGAGVLTFAMLAAAGSPNLAALGATLWAVAAVGAWGNVVAFRTIFYLPTFTSGVALMILWKAMYNPETGPINSGLRWLFAFLPWHLEPPQWLADVAWAKPALIAMGVWTAIGGTNMLLYLAGLANVSRELLDAAAVDGAGRWQRFRHVTWPQLAPTTFFIVIMSAIGGLQGGFEQARVMTGGGPAGATTTLSFYIYSKAFSDLDLGFAAAISWVLFAAIFAVTAVQWRFGRDLDA